MLIRDVTPGKAADQTIRSLLKFLQEKDEDRTSLLRRTNSAIESERNRIARDLHDGPVQGVSAASLSLEASLLMIGAGDVDRGVDVLSKVRKELADEADALRALMSGLRPPVLEERGLMPALREAVTRFGVEQGVEVDLVGTLPRPVSSDLETLAYRVVQEALTNAAKHARADRVVVSVETTATSLRVEVEDDGRGFDSAMTREFLRQGRVGLASMRERVELANGTFVIRSSPGRGTSIVATLPVDAPVEPRMESLASPVTCPRADRPRGRRRRRLRRGWGRGAGTARRRRGDGSSLGEGVGEGLGDGGGGSGASADGVTVCPSKDGSWKEIAFLPCMAISMKSFQIAAGIVPPNTWGTPSMFTSGIWPFGNPTQTQAAIWTV